MATLKRSERAPRNCSAISRCPVLEMGRNSVMPSTMPRMTVFRVSDTRVRLAGIGARVCYPEPIPPGRDARIPTTKLCAPFRTMNVQCPGNGRPVHPCAAYSAASSARRFGRSVPGGRCSLRSALPCASSTTNHASRDSVAGIGTVGSYPRRIAMEQFCSTQYRPQQTYFSPLYVTSENQQ